MQPNAALIIFIILSVLFSPAWGQAEDLSLTSRRPSPLLVVTPDGLVRTVGQALPKGYEWRDDGGVSAPMGVVVMPDGRVMSSDGKVPDGYARRQDGAVLTPDGVVIAKRERQPEAAAAPQEKPKPKEDPLLALLPTTDPSPEPVEKKEIKQKREKPVERAQTKPVRPEQPVPPREKEKPVPPPTREKEKPRPGENFKIPAEAARKKDLSFLEGCWTTDSMTFYTPFGTKNMPADFCFDANGKGRFLPKVEGRVCRGRATARFSGNSLFMESAEAPCPAGVNWRMMPRTFECTGTGASTECYIIATSPQNHQRYRSRARLRRR